MPPTGPYASPALAERTKSPFGSPDDGPVLVQKITRFSPLPIFTELRGPQLNFNPSPSIALRSQQ
jgi:hypothetical protein